MLWIWVYAINCEEARRERILFQNKNLLVQDTRSCHISVSAQLETLSEKTQQSIKSFHFLSKRQV